MVQTRVEVYESDGSTLLYTLKNFAADIKVKQILTSQVGNFVFTLQSPMSASSSSGFNDIVKHCLAKIWIEDGIINSAVDTPKCVGRVQTVKHDGGKDGVVKVVSGFDQGEILLRRITERRTWISETAHDIVVGLATDLGLGTGQIAADANVVSSLTVDNHTYMDILKKLSDYWVDASHKVQKDFYVDGSLNLVWKARPIRTTGVITPKFGQDYLSYSLVDDGSIGQLHNDITVYGRLNRFNPKNPDPTNPLLVGRTYPVNGDAWTWGTGWVQDIGTISQESGLSPKIGADMLKALCDPSGGGPTPYQTQFHRSISPALNVEGTSGYTQLQFWFFRHGIFATSPPGFTCKLYCPDTSNYYEWDIPDAAGDDVFEQRFAALGQGNTYDATDNPTGQWIAHGSPNWDWISGIQFFTQQFAPGAYWCLDGLCFSYGRWRANAVDSGSVTDYDSHQVSMTDDDLNSDAECLVRAESLLTQESLPIRRLDFSIKGTDNVLLGDQIPVTLPPEGLTASNYHVASILQECSGKGWTAGLTLLDSILQRKLPASSPGEHTIREFRRLIDVARGVTRVGK